MAYDRVAKAALLGGVTHLNNCDHRGFLLPTVMLPMNVPIPVPQVKDAPPDEKPKEALQTVFRTVEAICIRCGHIFQLQMVPKPATEEPKPESVERNENP